MGRCSAVGKTEISRIEAALCGGVRPARNACLFILGVETGLRISELLSIRLRDVFTVKGAVKDWLIIDRAHTKGKRFRRELPLSNKAKKYIISAAKEAYEMGRSRPEDWLFSAVTHSGAITRRHAYKIIAGALKASGVSHTRGTHTMRKTYAALLLEASEAQYRAGHMKVFPLVACQLGLGHQDIKTTQHYMDHGVEAVNVLIRNGLS